MKKYIYLVLIFLVLFLIFAIIKNLLSFHIYGKFQELKPIHGKLNVYYKGIIVGKAKELKHSFDFNHTLIKIMIFSKKLHLPSNTTIILKKEKVKNKEIDYLDLIYPKEPTNVLLANNSQIDGYVAPDMTTFLSNQHPDEIEEMKENLLKSTQNLSYALETLANVFETLDDILLENKNNIYLTTKNIQESTFKINKSIKQKQFEQTLSNVENLSKNISQTTNEINKTTPDIENSLSSTKQTMSNLSAITCGIRKTLSKKFGGLRLFFGRVIE